MVGERGLADAAFSESHDEIVDRYDTWAHQYEHDVRSWGYALPERIVDVIVASPGPTESVLDAGCGTGLIGAALRSRVTLDRLIGVDASAGSLSLAHQTGAYNAVSVVDLQAGLPFADREFDALVCGGVLTYIDDIGPVFDEFVRVVRPGGVVVASQRTDLWEPRATPHVISRLEASGHVAEVADPVPYLPGLADYGDLIEVIVVTLTVGVL